MTPDGEAAILARLDAMHEDLIEVKQLASETNGRVRKLEIWRAEVRAKFSVISSTARVSVTNFIAPVATGIVTAAVTALIFTALSN